jgi:hypothetical protein
MLDARMTTDPAAIGLCHRCVHARRVPTRHALYWRCALAESDPRFPRYPRLPVLACAGHEPTPEAPPVAGDAATPEPTDPEDPPARA